MTTPDVVINRRIDYINTPSIHTQRVDITFPPGTEKYVDLQCKGEVLYTNMPETQALDGLLNGLNPKTAIELGCGIGRATVYLSKRYGFSDTKFVMFDGDSGEQTLCGADRSGNSDFYNSLDMTRKYCEANQVKNMEIINAEVTPLTEIPHTFDLAYSFLAIGFHWSITMYLDQLHQKMPKGGVCIFGMQGNDKPDGDAFTKKQISSINKSQWNVLLNHRRPHRQRMSVLAIEKN